MGYIIRNGIKYFGDNSVELTQAQYDALPSSKLTDGVDYYITDAQAGAPLATEIAMSTSDNTSVAEMLTTQFVNNFVTTTGSAALRDNQCTIYGKIHSLRLYFATVNAGSGWVTQATVPEGHKPKGIMEFYLVDEAGGFNNAECRITTDGLIQVYSPTANMRLWGQGWWISE